MPTRIGALAIPRYDEPVEPSTHTNPKRAEWMQSPRYADQALLVHSHDSFVACANSIQERLRLLQGPEQAERRQKRLVVKLADFFREWQWAMGCHERYEEGKLYPFLTRRFGLSLSQLERDHALCHELADAAESAFRRVGGDVSDPVGWAAAEKAFASYQAFLIEHLGREEELVIPRLLELSAAEFSEYVAGETCSTDRP